MQEKPGKELKVLCNRWLIVGPENQTFLDFSLLENVMSNMELWRITERGKSEEIEQCV